jgi:hypothetical protein
MKRVLAALVVVLLTGATAWAGEMTPGAQEQPKPTGPTMNEAPAQPGMAPVKEIEGRIRATDRTGKSVTLDDGTRLVIPDSLRSSRDALKKGAMLKAMYEEKDGQKVVTWLEVQPEGRRPKS